MTPDSLPPGSLPISTVPVQDFTIRDVFRQDSPSFRGPVTPDNRPPGSLPLTTIPMRTIFVNVHTSGGGSPEGGEHGDAGEREEGAVHARTSLRTPVLSPLVAVERVENLLPAGGSLHRRDRKGEVVEANLPLAGLLVVTLQAVVAQNRPVPAGHDRAGDGLRGDGKGRGSERRDGDGRDVAHGDFRRGRGEEPRCRGLRVGNARLRRLPGGG